MRIRAEIELEIDVECEHHSPSVNYVQLTQEAESWGKCEVLRAERIEDDEEN
jgi:hypothetical protein